MSSGTFGAQAIEHSMRTLSGYVHDLVDAGEGRSTTVATRFAGFNTKLRLLINYMERDDVVRWLARELHVRSSNVKEWFARISAGGERTCPAGGAAQLAHRYALLLEIKRHGIDLRNFVSTMFGGSGSFDEAFSAFRDGLLQPFSDDVDALAKRLVGLAQRQPQAGLDELIDAALAAALVHDAGEGASACQVQPTTSVDAVEGASVEAVEVAVVAEVASNEDDGVGPLLAALCDAVDGSRASEGSKAEKRAAIAMIDMELGKAEANKALLAVLLGPLCKGRGAVAEAASALLSAVED